MVTRVNYATVGGFIILSIAALTIGVIWLAAGFSLEKYTTYQVYINETVAGLNIDASVEFNGVNVGKVSSIYLDQQNPSVVVLLLKIKNGTPITQGTKATIGTKGLTGIAYVSLMDQGNNLQPIALVPGDSYATIKSAPSLLWQLDSGIRKLSDNFNRISDYFSDIFNADNRRAMTNILRNLDYITQKMAQQEQHVQKLLLNSADSMHTINTSIIPKLDAISSNLMSFSADLKDNPAILLRGKASTTQGPGE